MKNKILWVLVIISSIVVLGVIIMLGFNKKVEITSIKKLHFSYSNGYMMNSNTIYDLEKRNEKYYVTIKPYLVSDEDAKTVEVDEKTIDKIKDVLNKYEVNKWDGFNKSDKYVLDGDSFSFWLYTDEDSDIHASGYMKWPKNYGEVKSELDSILGPLYPNKVEE